MLKRPPQTSPLFDVYWQFAAARQELYFARLEGKPQPWTADPILAEHRFTNAYRAADRVSQFLIRDVIYDPRFQSPDDLVYRLLLFKFFVDAKDHAPTDLIQFMVDRQEEEFDRLGIRFRDLFGRRLQPIDCQNLFCEISKYSRVSHPELAGVAGRTRIKQRYKKDLQPFPAPWFPPKWGLNDRLPAPVDGLPSTFKTSE